LAAARDASHVLLQLGLAVHKDVNKLVLQSDHDSVDTMWRNYHAGVPEVEAKRFWEILPPGQAERKIIPLARA